MYFSFNFTYLFNTAVLTLYRAIVILKFRSRLVNLGSSVITFGSCTPFTKNVPFPVNNGTYANEGKK
jgi:hypothetical protein